MHLCFWGVGPPRFGTAQEDKFEDGVSFAGGEKLFGKIAFDRLNVVGLDLYALGVLI